MKYILLSLLTFSFLSCLNEKQSEERIQEAINIVNKTLQVSGSENIEKSIITFDFRDKSYKAIRDHGFYQLERSFRDATTNEDLIVRDVLSNDGFKRFSNGKELLLEPNKKSSYSASVNSVHYFSVLPFGLNDAAVIKTQKENVSINEIEYYTIQVTFNEEGGGEDYEDIFLYWINSDTYFIDYLAYSYNELEGKGLRFREAYNERFVKGIRFADYNNYKPKAAKVKLSELPQLFESGELELLSKIELEKLTVN